MAEIDCNIDPLTYSKSHAKQY